MHRGRKEQFGSAPSFLARPIQYLDRTAYLVPALCSWRIAECQRKPSDRHDMKKVHCRRCFQPVVITKPTCPRCGETDMQRVCEAIAIPLVLFGAITAMALAMWAFTQRF